MFLFNNLKKCNIYSFNCSIFW